MTTRYTETDLITCGSILKKHRNNLLLTVEDVATELNVPTGRISEIESSQDVPNPDELRKWVKYLSKNIVEAEKLYTLLVNMIVDIHVSVLRLELQNLYSTYKNEEK